MHEIYKKRLKAIYNKRQKQVKSNQDETIDIFRSDVVSCCSNITK